MRELGLRGNAGKGRTRKFDDKQIAEMQALLAKGKDVAAIGKKFGVSGSAVEWQIKRYGAKDLK